MDRSLSHISEWLSLLVQPSTTGIQQPDEKKGTKIKAYNWTRSLPTDCANLFILLVDLHIKIRLLHKDIIVLCLALTTIIWVLLKWVLYSKIMFKCSLIYCKI